MRYLPVDVYRSSGTDCSNGGVTSPTCRLQMVVPVEDGYLKLEDLGEDHVILEPGEILGCKNFVPSGLEGWTMMGGNFVYTSDSRFSKAYGHAPVAVHDRVER